MFAYQTQIVRDVKFQAQCICCRDPITTLHNILLLDINIDNIVNFKPLTQKYLMKNTIS